MNKNTCKTVALAKGEMRVYDFGDIRLHAYQTHDPIDDEVFILEKNGEGVCIELPCFRNNIRELTEYLQKQRIAVTAKLVAYHAAGTSFLPDVPTYGTQSSAAYSRTGGAGLIAQFKGAFGDNFDSTACQDVRILKDGEITLAGIRTTITSNAEAYDIEIPEINCVYTHMMGHDCHSIVSGCPHADGIISQLRYYLRRGFGLVLTSHYTPEDLKDVQTKIDYLSTLKDIAMECTSAEEMRHRVLQTYPEYSGLNYLDMTVRFFFSAHV